MGRRSIVRCQLLESSSFTVSPLERVTVMEPGRMLSRLSSSFHTFFTVAEVYQPSLATTSRSNSSTWVSGLRAGMVTMKGMTSSDAGTPVTMPK